MLQGCGLAVVEDREHYRILRYIYISPVPFAVQLFGRSAPKAGIATVGAGFTILAGYLFLDIPFNPAGIDWGMLLDSFVLGLIGCLMIGWILAGVMLLIDRMGWVMVEGFAGGLFLLSGAIIPLPVLPGFLSEIGKVMPLTYWAELTRLALYGQNAALSLPGVAASSLWMMLLLTTSIITAVAFLWSRTADRLARSRGRIEAETFY